MAGSLPGHFSFYAYFALAAWLVGPLNTRQNQLLIDHRQCPVEMPLEDKDRFVRRNADLGHSFHPHDMRLAKSILDALTQQIIVTRSWTRDCDRHALRQAKQT